MLRRRRKSRDARGADGAPQRRGIRRRVGPGLRVRRAPEESRQLLLDAAERLFRDANPDEVGLKEVAREAGVSHALITHYFGTYAGLVQAALERRLATLRETIRTRLQQADALERPDELLGLLFGALEDPVHLRLMKWAAASERQEALRAFALQHRGLSVVAQHVAAALRPPSGATYDVARLVANLESPPRRERRDHDDAVGAVALVGAVEVALVTAVAAAMGYAVSKAALAGAIGRAPSAALDAAVRRTLAAMLQSYLRDVIDVPT